MKGSGLGALISSGKQFENLLNKEAQKIGALAPDWGIGARINSGQSKFFKLSIEGFTVDVQDVCCFSLVTLVGLEYMGDIK